LRAAAVPAGIVNGQAQHECHDDHRNADKSQRSYDWPCASADMTRLPLRPGKPAVPARALALASPDIASVPVLRHLFTGSQPVEH
jgi:hypothetical protein